MRAREWWKSALLYKFPPLGEHHDLFLSQSVPKMILQVHSFIFSHPTTPNNMLVIIGSPADFEALRSQIIQFNTGDTVHNFTLTIANDGICEVPNENFIVNITVVSGTQPIFITTHRAHVIINDMNEPECGECIGITNTVANISFADSNSSNRIFFFGDIRRSRERRIC